MVENKLWPYVLSLFRVIVGALFVCHGAATLFGVLGGTPGTGGATPAGTWPGWWAALIQFLGGALVVVGLGTRWAALLCSGSMAYAYFTIHQEKAALPIQNGGEAAVMFCWAFLLIALAGPGAWAVDALLTRSDQQAGAREPSNPVTDDIAA
ncbi:DoxX family protein [Streptacidiphilus sp. PB12-B1b]|uniref:DoxX family protein n=1 Tax=Streptacidiphilus sp. PB12-B1b TaxID=2705012 RepID=UPI0015FAA050|nr:DoxX family protein [Streptacidiphilus sp. PB12-B1b]QMU78072.1 DoxX family protein [Streptacidiphilus sp. PB12-B1b]